MMLMICCGNQGFGQICNGNLGINIFEEGDFGSGAFNILPRDPGIAPGYMYQTSPPPNDGFYTISNNTGPWGSFAQANWANVTDNSSDPQGYMMVVNASYTPGLFYEQEVDELCGDTDYVFSVDVFNLMLSGGIQPNVTFLLDGVEVYSTGAIGNSNQWRTYGFSFTTAPNQTSLTLSLRNNAPGGIGNDLALDNISFRACGPEALILPEEVANICEDGQPITLEATILENFYDTTYIQWQQSFDGGQNWVSLAGYTGTSIPHTNLSGGFYYYRYLLSNDPVNLQNPKCRIVSNVKIVHVVPKFYTINDTLCDGLSFSLGNNFYAQSGTYIDSLKTSLGCDSIVTLNLTIVPDANVEADIVENDPSCPGYTDGSIYIDEIRNGYLPYSILANGMESEFGAIGGLPAGAYPYLITDRYGCFYEQDVMLADPDSFVLDLGMDQEIELGDSLILDISSTQPIQNYSWRLEDSLLCALDCIDWVWLPAQSDWLYALATSDKGCSAFDSVFVRVIPNRFVFSPTAFTPNGDGINDHYNLFGPVPKIASIERLAIYNRWGGKVFDKANVMPNVLEDGWDGTQNGRPAQQGVYMAVASIRYLDGVSITSTYSVTLIR